MPVVAAKGYKVNATYVCMTSAVTGVLEVLQEQNLGAFCRHCFELTKTVRGYMLTNLGIEAV